MNGFHWKNGGKPPVGFRQSDPSVSLLHGSVLVRTSVPVHCQCLLQWPVPVYRACTNWIGLYQAVAAGQCVPIRWSGKIQACHITYLHVGQTVCDRSLLIACVQRATKYSHNISTILVFVPVGISWLAFDKGNVNGKRWYGSDGSAAVAMVTPHWSSLIHWVELHWNTWNVLVKNVNHVLVIVFFEMEL